MYIFDMDLFISNKEADYGSIIQGGVRLNPFSSYSRLFEQEELVLGSLFSFVFLF